MMHRRRSSDVSLSSSSNGGGSSDGDDGEEKGKKKKRNIFKNLIPRRWKPRQHSQVDTDNVSGSSWFTNPSRPGEAEKTKGPMGPDTIDKPNDPEPVSLSVGSTTTDHPRPIVPPRRRKQSPVKATPVSVGSSLDEILSPPISQLQCSRPVVYSRTSSHSSGFEEGSSSLTETSDASTWKDLIPRVADRVEGPRWTGESLTVRASPANNIKESIGDTRLKSGKSDTPTTCDEDILVFSPQGSSLSAEEVVGVEFNPKGNPLASFKHHAECESAAHALAVMLPVPYSPSYSRNKRPAISDRTGLISREITDARTPTHSTITREPTNLESETGKCTSGSKIDLEAFPKPSKADFDCELETRSSPLDQDNNGNFQDGHVHESHLHLHGTNTRSSCIGVAKEIEDTETGMNRTKTKGYNQFNEEPLRTGVAPLESAELLKCPVISDSMFTRSTQTPVVEETLHSIRQSMNFNSTNQRKYSSSSSTSCDKDSPIPAISDRDRAVPDKSMDETDTSMDEKAVTSSKNKPAVAPKPRGNLYRSRSQVQSSRRPSGSTTNEPPAQRASQTKVETRGASERRKNISFIVNDEDFGRYLSKPHGIETRMVLPFTERQKLPDFGGQSDNMSSMGRTWIERHFPPPQKPIFPGSAKRLDSERVTFDEGQPSISKNQQSVTNSTVVMRRHTDIRDRPRSDIGGAFGTHHDVSRTLNTINDDRTHTEHKEHRSRNIPISFDDYSSTPQSDKYKPGRAVVSSRPIDLSDRISTSIQSTTFSDKREVSPAARISDRSRGVDQYASENLNTPISSRISRSRTKDSAERVTGTQSIRRKIQEGLHQSAVSQKNVDADLEMAKKFEAFNVRLAAMASAAAAKRSSNGTVSDFGKPLGSLWKGKWMSTDGLFEVGGGSGHNAHRTASVFEGENNSLWKSETLPVFGESDKSNSQISDKYREMPRGVYRSQSVTEADMKAKYQRFLERRSHLVSADRKSGNGFEESSENNFHRTNNSGASSKTAQRRDQRLSSSYSDLNHNERGDEFASAASDSDVRRLETSGEQRSGSDRGLFRNHSKGEYDQLYPKPRKTLREQGEELQRQFSSWHRLLVSEKSTSFLNGKETPDKISKLSGSAILGRSNSESLVAGPEFERLQNQSAERTPVRMGTKPIVRRPVLERRVQETNSEPAKTLPWLVSYELIPKDPTELVSSGGSLDKTLGGRSLRRSASCAQPQIVDLFPRTAMAKFNDDGTPKSILKKANSDTSRSQSAYERTEEEEDEYDDEFDPKGIDGSVRGILLHSPPAPPPMPSFAPPDIPPHRQTTSPSPIPSYQPPSPPPPFPSSRPPSSRSQARTSTASFLPPPSPSTPPRHPSSFPPPTPPRRLASLSSPTILQPSLPQSSSKSPSPLPQLSESPQSPPPPLPSTSPPPIPPRSSNSDVSPSSISPGSDASSSSSFTWSADPGSSSKFLGLQNLQKRTAFLKKRSRSDLGATASILNALNQH